MGLDAIIRTLQVIVKLVKRMEPGINVISFTESDLRWDHVNVGCRDYWKHYGHHKNCSGNQ